MPRHARSFVFALGLIAILALATSCSDSPTAPTPTLKTETFTGTLGPREVKSHTFTIEYNAAYSDASVTVKKLTSLADGTDKDITVGVGFGTISVGVCTRAAAYTNVAAPLNVELPTSGSAFSAGTYCISIFDNLDAQTVTETLSYSIDVKHY